MSLEVSPAVERAGSVARGRAERAGSPTVRLSDWLLGVLEEDEGRPFELLVRLGFDVRALQRQLEVSPPIPAPSTDAIYTAAKGHSIRLRGEPSLTTDLVMLAVMMVNDSFRAALERYGIRVGVVEHALRSDMMAAPDTIEQPPAEFVAAEPVDQSDAARILDANLNRARESLRVLDDYARFSLNDAALTEELKRLRHRLADATELLPPSLLLQSRNTLGDVGTTISTAGEFQRATPRQVAAVNFKRLQESLRSLEEFGKLDDARFAREVEQIRYAAYTLERAVLTGSAGRERLAAARLYVLLTGSQCVNTMDWTIAEAAAGGASVFQLREKQLPDRELIALAHQVRKWTHKANALFIVNDRPDIARLVGADGVHLGQDDLSPHDARRILGPDPLIGVSSHSLAQVRQAILDSADYLGVGPTFPSTTKGFDQLAGLEFVQAAFAATTLPAFALGGIRPENIAEVVAAGGNRVAVSAVVAEAEEPQVVARQLFGALSDVSSG
ncbi:thiamine phosphate synthase [Limnoglobus roseus]|uniref:Thiamine-phosphate synthase n=1 Tax=Limnoglobus roseus TaxID=2598579 RepID=A0A5C1AC83_9BACT|nr:thiamine phosphate synthase [Limnoglobus roseus]QEL16989.1 thiamine phosphate synthase [Limnoglobus roseus]